MDDETKLAIKQEHALLNQMNENLMRLLEPVKNPDPRIYTQVVQLDSTQSSGHYALHIPFPAMYVSVINQTGATVYIADGTLFSLPVDAIPVQSGQSWAFAIRKSEQQTLFYQGTVQANANTVLVQYSDYPLQLNGTSGSVTVSNTTSNPVPTSLTGRNVIEPTPLLNALAITDTVFHFTSQIDISAYKRVQFLLTNTLNQNLTVRLYPDGGNTGFIYNGTSWVANDLTIPANQGLCLLNTSWSFFDQSPAPVLNGKLYIGVQCTVAPTSGSVTLNLLGVPN